MTDLTVGNAPVGIIPSPRAVVIRLSNTTQIANAKSKLAGLASRLVPDMIDAEVNGEVLKEIQKTFQKEGITADVQVVDARTLSGASPAPKASDSVTLLKGIAIGAGVVGSGVILYHLLFGGKK